VAEIVTSFLCQWSVNAVAFLYMSRQHCFVAVNQPPEGVSTGADHACRKKVQSTDFSYCTLNECLPVFFLL